ncbi:Yersinia protein of uncharacterised function (DUF3831) [Yersinia enterocolitica]|nr:Yersinia protein of uncharacterised function (DUF3831) [Yersinia enterocolitica]
MTNLSYSNWQGEDRQKSKASVPGMTRLEPTWMDGAARASREGY